MGSELRVDGETVWLNFLRLGTGAFMQLRIGSNVVKPGRPLRMSYGEIAEFLRATHDVREFPYDWRKPVEEEADRLAAQLSDALDETRQAAMPVRILAHSMGGLVARTAILCGTHSAHVPAHV
jgi:hypothetical protein